MSAVLLKLGLYLISIAFGLTASIQAEVGHLRTGASLAGLALITLILALNIETPERGS